MKVLFLSFMNKQKLNYLLHSGKNSKLVYYIHAYLCEWTPKVFTRSRLEPLLREAADRDDYPYMLERVNYYNRLSKEHKVDAVSWKEKSVETDRQPMTRQSVYYHDSMEILRYFDGRHRCILDPGDVTHIPPLPAVVKSRPLSPGNTNSVLLKLNKVRHFLYVNDHKQWQEKEYKILFRGDLGPRKVNRTLFMELYHGHPLVDAGMTNHYENHEEWFSRKMTIGEHLRYKFIMSLEGNDVASNLKWVMSSNCLAVMPRPTCETWFMEGLLKPDYHYIEIKEDMSDLIEKTQYYVDHPQEAQAIIDHAHEWVGQFRNKHRELLISLMVMQKYFAETKDLA